MSRFEGSSILHMPHPRLQSPPVRRAPAHVFRPSAAASTEPSPPLSSSSSNVIGMRSYAPRFLPDVDRPAPPLEPFIKKQKDGPEKVKVEGGEGAGEEGHKEEFNVEMLPTPSEAIFKRSRKLKPSKPKNFMPETPGLTEGDHKNSILSANNCRYDSSLGLLTKKFINLLQQAEDGTLDLNRAADILEVQKRRIYDITNVLEGVGLIEKTLKNRVHWKGIDMSRPKDDQTAMLKAEVESLFKEDCRLDQMIRDLQENLQVLTADENTRKLLYLTEEDINNTPRFQGATLIAIKAPHGTSVEVPDPDEGIDFPQKHYQILLRSSMGPIDCYLISNHEERDDTSNQNQQPAAMELDVERCNNNAALLQPTDCVTNGTSERGQDYAASKSSPDSPVSQESMAGILKIVPSDLDVDADYWLLSDIGVSMTDTWGS
ncbi:transcription factor E2FB-like isoform X2 [Typha angustifolia]|uniref:transcription factor E2FB-like isoform X2 n=1 Tax=Typha angustifolia TaxID=59011 RepID=UPI003C2CE148